MKEMPDTCPGCGKEFRDDGTCPSTLDVCGHAGLDIYEIAMLRGWRVSLIEGWRREAFEPSRSPRT